MRLNVIAFMFLLLTFSYLFAKQDKKNGELSDNLSTKFKQWNDSLPEDRVYIQCDKPFYFPGESIWFTAYFREAASFKASSKSDILHVELINPKGSVEKKISIVGKNGIAQGDFELNNDIPGGIYTLKAYTNWQKNDPDPAFFIKEIQIQETVLPSLKMKLEFDKKAYGPGDRVKAELSIETNQNKPLSLFPANYTVSINGKQIMQNSVKGDKNGKAILTFDLPSELSSTDGILNVLLDHDGSKESISRSIPVVLNKISLSFFPEGGDAVCNLTSLIAFKAMDEFGKGADIEGYITDNNNNKVTEFSSFHRGMGAFILTPQNGKRYKAHITRPKGITESFDLPEPLPQGYVLRIEEISQNSLKMAVGSTRDENLRIFLQIRGKEYFSKVINARKGMTSVNIDLTKMPIGAAQITLFDSKEIQRSERLVFVNKHKQLSLNIKTDKEKYLPREKVKMTITATDETGMRMPGNFSLAISDDQLLSFADDKSSTILSHMLFESDLKGKIEEPRFYFDPKQQKADRALDLLMMTQGWRRFTWRQITADEIPAVSYPSERAIIAGFVMDRSTNKGIPGTKVRITELKLESLTDSSGAFLFKNVDLTEPKTIEAENGNRYTSMKINKYTSTLQLWIYPQIQYEHKMVRAAGNLIEKEQEGMVAEAMMAPPPAMENVELYEKVAPPPRLPNAPEQKMEAPKDLKILDEEIKADRAAPLMKRKVKDFAADLLPAPIEEAPAVVYYRAREYPAPDYKDQMQPSIRNDFRSTIFWKGDVELKNNGAATVEFYTSDALTSFRAIAEGFAVDGGIGRAEHVFYSEIPFNISAKVPPTLITGDTLDLPVLLKNTTTGDLNGTLSINIPSSLKLLNPIDPNQTLKAKSTRNIHLKMLVESVKDSAKLSVSFNAKGLSDAVTFPLKIIPQGFPVDLSFSGSELKRSYSVKIDNPVKNSIKASFRAYPSVVSDLLTGIESILQEPYGCFEQTSMTSYPNALVLSYLRANSDTDQKIVNQAETLLEKGYKKLVTFETKEKGFEWFGSAPGHEALTAYGLMQFNDMNKISKMVDNSMVERTAAWLMSRRDGNGGFLRNPQALDSYGRADDDITNAYIVYALAEAGRRDIQKELDEAVKSAHKSNDPYVQALVANALYCFQDFNRGDELLNKFLSKQEPEGFWCGTRHSITRSEGISLKLETTSLACMAIMKSKKPDLNALTKGVKFIVASRSGNGGFGATQSTILCLKTLTQYSQFARRTESPGTIVISVNRKIVTRKKYEAGEREAIVIDSLERYLKDGTSEIEVSFEDTKNALPFSLSVSYNTWQPSTAEQCKVKLETAISANKIKVGQTVRISTVLSNKTITGLPMTIAVLGLPAGVSAQPWQLKELQEKKIVDFYEVTPSTVIFYFRQMKPEEVRTINLDCKAEIPGFYTAPSSRAYLYYTNEYKAWTSIKPLKVEM